MKMPKLCPGRRHINHLIKPAVERTITETNLPGSHPPNNIEWETIRESCQIAAIRRTHQKIFEREWALHIYDTKTKAGVLFFEQVCRKPLADIEFKVEPQNPVSKNGNWCMSVRIRNYANPEYLCGMAYREAHADGHRTLSTK